ncbi:hypothetical protein ACFOYW_08320 [Gryllotalpicola reticulitermitis]|uniref:YdeI/OmpD-associated family protein n=1 Tax=Gryllotalpicola reticulitermitis TaxID=1184153 RepID=A0ABV8Q4X0_9MICO
MLDRLARDGEPAVAGDWARWAMRLPPIEREALIDRTSRATESALKRLAAFKKLSAERRSS